MGVVAAGVHDAVVLGPIRDIVGFLDRKSIDICAQCDGAITLTLALDQSQNPGLPNSLVGDSQSVEFLFDALGRPILFESQLGMLVECSA